MGGEALTFRPCRRSTRGAARLFRRRLSVDRALAAALLELFIGGAAISDRPASASEPLRIVATTSDLASLAREVTGELAEVASLIPPSQNGESYEPRPRDLDLVRKASVVVRVGLDYDLWLDRLLAGAGAPAVQRGGEAYVDASRGVALLELKGQGLGPTMGHAHGAGNPHYWLDPSNAEPITGGIAAALIRVDPEHAADYRSRRGAFLARLARDMAGWKREGAALRGARVVAYHNTWPYFARRFRLNIIEIIEPREGVSPGPSHLAEIRRHMQTERAALILIEPHAPQETARLLSERTGAKVVMLAPSVDALPGTASYSDLIGANVRALVSALRR